MPIYKIDEVRINGKNQAFGGYIYAVDMKVGLTEGPTSIVVTFNNESGEYLEPELSDSKAYRIQIGNIVNENYYAVRREIKKSSGGRTLEVTFWDGSLILDKIYVGLYKRHGDERTNIDGLLIVGREIHPCDVNEDGVFDQRDAIDLQWQDSDPCELRCPSDSNARQPIVERCLDREITEVFEVKYSFRDLLNALEGKPTKLPARGAVSYPVPADLGAGSVNVSIPVTAPTINLNVNRFNRVKIKNIPSNLNDAYMQNYTGTLREVLRSWCADFGWSFYWEQDTLNFIDTSARPRINFGAFNNLESVSDVKTLEGTVARGFISRFAEPGIKSEQNCTYSRPFLLRCLTLGDLFGSKYKPVWKPSISSQGDYVGGSAPLDPPVQDPNDANDTNNQIEYLDDVYQEGVDIKAFEKSCVFANYSDTLRHLYNLWEYYKIKDASEAEKLKGKWLDRLGQMKFINVLHSGGASTVKAKYEMLKNGLLEGSKKKFLSDEEREHMDKYKGYFVVVQRNRKQDGVDLIEKQFSVEENLATNFMGRHWYRAYAAPFIGETPQITPNGQYFGALSTNVKDIPFANYGHTYKSPISKMVSSFVQRQRNDFRQYNRLRFTQNYAKNTSKKIVRSILYMQKETSETWNPLKNSQTSLDSLTVELGKKMFRKIDISQLPAKSIKALCTDENGKVGVKDELIPNVELYIFYPGSLDIESNFVENPYEEHPMHLESLEPFALATAGLLSKRCVRYTVKGVPIFTPAGASVLFHEQYNFKWSYREPDVKDFQAPSYKIYVSNSVPNRGLVPKTEAVFINPANVKGTLKTDYQTKELTRDSTKFISKLTKECSIDAQSVLTLHDKFSKNLNFSISEPFQTRSYRMMGLKLPTAINIKNGLESVSVRIDDNGVFTDISIGNSLFTPPEPDYITRLMELGIDVRALNARVNPL